MFDFVVLALIFFSAKRLARKNYLFFVDWNVKH